MCLFPVHSRHRVVTTMWSYHLKIIASLSESFLKKHENRTSVRSGKHSCACLTTGTKSPIASKLLLFYSLMVSLLVMCKCMRLQVYFKCCCFFSHQGNIQPLDKQSQFSGAALEWLQEWMPYVVNLVILAPFPPLLPPPLPATRWVAYVMGSNGMIIWHPA